MPRTHPCWMPCGARQQEGIPPAGTAPGGSARPPAAPARLRAADVTPRADFPFPLAPAGCRVVAGGAAGRAGAPRAGVHAPDTRPGSREYLVDAAAGCLRHLAAHPGCPADRRGLDAPGWGCHRPLAEVVAPPTA